MALGRRREERQQAIWISAEAVGLGPRNVFYDRLNRLLAEIEFDRKLEAAAEEYYETTGRKSLPPGVYFRMLSLTRDRLPKEIHDLAFELVLAATQKHGLLKGKTIGVDATDLEANAAMKSIVRRDNGDDWREYVRKLYEAETGEANPDDEELRRFDRARKNKKVSNEEWVSKTDADARIGKMKDGSTHLKYKAENAVDLETEVIVTAEVYHGDQGDTATNKDTVIAAQTHLTTPRRTAKSKRW